MAAVLRCTAPTARAAPVHRNSATRARAPLRVPAVARPSLRAQVRVPGRSTTTKVMASGVLAPPANYQNIVTLGEKKAQLPIPKIAAMGVMAGIYIGFGAFLAASVGGACAGLVGTNPGLQKIVLGAFGLPFGLLMVLTVGAELFTGNTALVTAAVYEGKADMGQLAKSWIVSFVFNFIGSLLMVYMVKEAGLFNASSAPVGIAMAKTSLSFTAAFFRGLMCNFLVCIAIVQASAAQDLAGKIVGIWFPISAFVALGLEHSVANMFLIPMGIALGAKVTFAKFLTANLLPVTLGNIVGGALFVATAYAYIFGSLGKSE